MREIRQEHLYRGQTYLAASHSQLRYLISRRDGENNGFLAGVPLLPPSSRAVSRPNSLPLPFRTPATQFSAFSLCDMFAYSCLKLKPKHKFYQRNPSFKTRWNWFYVRLLNAVFDFRLFDCLSVHFPNVRLCSIGRIFGWVRLCSIAEPNRSQSNDWASVGFDYRTFDFA